MFKLTPEQEQEILDERATKADRDSWYDQDR